MASIEIRRIADRLNRAVNGPAWHGPAILKPGEGRLGEDAAAKPSYGGPTPSGNWSQYTAAWLEIVRLRLEGEAPRRITQAMNSQPIRRPPPRSGPSPSIREWRADIDRLRRAARDLQSAIRSFDDH